MLTASSNKSQTGSVSVGLRSHSTSLKTDKFVLSGKSRDLYWELTDSSLGQWGFRGFPESLPADTGIMPLLGFDRLLLHH
jgi:hypothetical protein